MMAGVIEKLCMLSILCGLTMCLTPEGGVKRVMCVLCTLILTSTVLSAVKGFDFDSYALQLSRYREQEQGFLQENQDMRRRLNRLVIEEEYTSYILDKATTMGMELEHVSLEVQWNMDGVWVPYVVSIQYRGEEGKRRIMEDLISGDLGIPAERQYWSHDD